MTVPRPETPDRTKPKSQQSPACSSADQKRKQQTSILSFFGTGTKLNSPSISTGASTPTSVVSPLQSKNKLAKYSFSYQVAEESDDDTPATPSKVQYHIDMKNKKILRIFSDEETDNLGSAQSEPNIPASLNLKPAGLKNKLDNPFSTPQPKKISKAAYKMEKILLNNDKIEEELENIEKSEKRYEWLVHIRDADGNPMGHPDYNPRTLFIPAHQWSKFTPFERQYWEIKSQYFDTVIMFKKGKFYELYEPDADIGAKEFDLKMTERINMRMAGIPEASFDFWAGKFVSLGYKIGKVDQLETSIGKTMREKSEKASSSKNEKIIKRELSCILTAGTLTDTSLMPSDNASYCMAVKERLSNDTISMHVCLADASTCTILVSSFMDDKDYLKFSTLVSQFCIKEVFHERGNLSPKLLKLIKLYLPNASLASLTPSTEFWDETRTSSDLSLNFPLIYSTSEFKSIEHPAALSCLGALIWYFRSLKLDQAVFSQARLKLFDPMQESTSLVIDHQTLMNLEILQNNYDFTEQGSLFQLIDNCSTAFGKRLLRQWICHPLSNLKDINSRLDSVEYLISNYQMQNQLDLVLLKLPDLERLVSRISMGKAKIKDFLATLDAFDNVQLSIRNLNGNSSFPLFINSIITEFPNLKNLLDYFKNGFDYSLVEKGGFITPNPKSVPEYDAIVQRLDAIQNDFTSYLAEQSKILNCNSLKYKDIGKELFQLEVPSHMKVPSEFMVMSKTKSVNRYWTSRIRSLVQQYQEADELKTCCLNSVFSRLMKTFSESKEVWFKAIKCLSNLDCILSLTKSSLKLGLPSCRPSFLEKDVGVFRASELRHPTVCRLKDFFVSNDISIGGGSPQMILLTGPNMGGKSTLLRQTCLAIVLAQIGMFVPASSCALSVFDRVFTRIGANDNIAAGQSTFMNELTETCRILKESTERSFVILDELGRGTSTYDGMAIAYATLHYLTRSKKCSGLFSTHYQQLAREFEHDHFVSLCYMQCETSNGNDITFLYKLKEGACFNSYGINVAAMAGLPMQVINEAQDMAMSITCVGNEAGRQCGIPIRLIFDLMMHRK